MSAIDELIAELCPDGVEWKRLGDVCSRQKGMSITATKMKEIADSSGDVIVFGGGKTKVLACREKLPNGNIIETPSVVVKSRGNIGFEYCEVPFTNKSELWSYSSASTGIDIKFVCYYLESNRAYFQEAAKLGKLPQISTGVTDNYEIPVPPIEVQREIMRILDTFVALTDELTAKLAEEVAARKEQYAYYRDRLLSRESLEAMDGKPVEMVNLGDLFDTFTGKTPRKSDTMLYGSDFPFYKPGDYDHGGVADKSSDMLSSSGFENARQVKPGSILVTCIGATIGKVGFVQRKGTCNQQINAILPNKIVNSKFVFHYCCSSKFQTTVWKKANHSSIPNLSLSSFNNIPIPVPSLATQQRVVDILDRLDALTTSLTDGIPAEIEARRTQYGYYRDRLLDFPRKGGVAA